MSYLRLLAIVGLGLTLTACGEGGRFGLTLITAGDHAVVAGETLYGDLLLTGGRLTVAPDARVAGTLHVLAGEAVVGGAVAGDLIVLGGALRLEERARVAGDLELGGGSVERAPGAAVGGEVRVTAGPALPQATPAQSLAERLGWWLMRSLALAVVAVLAVRFLPRRTKRVAQALAHHPLVAGAMGVLAGVAGLALLVLMAYTIVLIPVALLGLLAGGALVAAGWVALGVAAGGAMAARLPRPPSPAAAALLGTLAVLALLELLAVVPAVGDLLALVATAAGAGAMLLTRLGAREFVPDTPGVAEATGPLATRET